MDFIIKNILYGNSDSLEKLATCLNVTTRQIIYDIKKINIFFQHQTNNKVIEIKKNGSIHCNKDILLKFEQKQYDDFKFSQDKRIFLIETIVGMNTVGLNINELSRQLNVSRITIKNDLELVKEKLDSLGIQLNYDRQFYLTGSPENIYSFQLQLMMRLRYLSCKSSLDKIEEIIQDHFDRSFQNARIVNINHVLNLFMSENYILIKDSDFEWIESNIQLLIWYTKRGKEIPKMTSVNKLNYLDCSSLYLAYESFFGFQFPIEVKERIHSLFAIVGAQRINQIDKLNVEIIAYLFKLITYLEDVQEHYVFRNDIMLLNGLYYHLDRNLKKNRVGIHIDETPSYDVDIDINMTKEICQLIDKFCLEVEPLENYFLPLEQDYIKLYFRASIYRNYPFPKKKIVLVSEIRYFIRLQLMQILEQQFEVEVIENFSVNYTPFYKNWDKVDLVIYTESLPDDLRVPSLKVNPYLSQQDFSNLINSGIYLTKDKNPLDYQKIYRYIHKKNVMVILILDFL